MFRPFGMEMEMKMPRSVASTAEHTWVKREGYDRAVSSIKAAIGEDFDRSPLVVRDILWSTAVQQGAGSATKSPGGATRIFIDAVRRTNATTNRNAPNYYEAIIRNIYHRRTIYWLSDRIRYQSEMLNALRRLGSH